MSNIFPPKLMPVLEPLPEKNDIHPLDYVSNSISNYPPIKTPKLQELQNETVSYPEFRNQPDIPTIVYPAKQAIGLTQIIREIKTPIKTIKYKKIKKSKISRSRNNELYIIILYIILIILIYFVLQLIF